MGIRIQYHVTKLTDARDHTNKHRPWVMVFDDLECIEAIQNDPYYSYEVALESARYKAAQIANIVYHATGKMVKPEHKGDDAVQLLFADA
jgi:hypothetical protein